MARRSFSDYFRFQRAIFAAIVSVFVIRLVMSWAGFPNSYTRWVSVNLVLGIGLLTIAVAIPLSGFGGYKSLFVVLLNQTVLAQGLVALAIIAGIITGVDNVYTTPEFARSPNGKIWGHVIAHLVFSMILTVISFLAAVPIFFATQMATRGRKARVVSASGV